MSMSLIPPTPVALDVPLVELFVVGAIAIALFFPLQCWEGLSEVSLQRSAYLILK
jgi:hypothetical protein